MTNSLRALWASPFTLLPLHDKTKKKRSDPRNITRSIPSMALLYAALITKFKNELLLYQILRNST